MEASQAPLSGRSARYPHGEHRRPAVAEGVTLLLVAGPDGAGLHEAIVDAQQALSGLKHYEILVIAANKTAAAATAAIKSSRPGGDSNIRLIETQDADGLNWLDALPQVKHEWIAVARADGRYQLGELTRLLAFSADFDVVQGYRIERPRSVATYVLGRSEAILAKLFAHTGARDPACGLQVFRRSLLLGLPGFARDDFSRIELLARLRLAEAKIVEIPVTYHAGAAPSQTWTSSTLGGRVRECVANNVTRPVRWLKRLVTFWWSERMFPVGNAKVAGRAAEAVWHGNQAIAAWGVLIAAAVIFFFGHLSYPLLEPDESRYARIAQQMVRSGDYVVPYRFDEPYLDKPPMLYWLTAANYHLFGVSDGTARITCALAALVAVLVTYGMGQRLVGQRAAWMGAFCLMLCSGFALGGKFLIMDGLLTCFVTLAMMSGYLAIQGPRVRPGWCVAASLFCGLGVMTKGPLAIVLFLPPLFAARWISGSGASLRLRDWALCLVPGAVLALPWFVMVSLREPKFLEYFFWRHNIERFTTDFSHDQPWWYYIPVFLLGMFPASLLLGPLGVMLFGGDARLRARRTPEMGYLVLVSAWILFFFSLSRGKLPPYIIPVLPPMCLLCGKLLDLLVSPQAHAEVFRRCRYWLPELIIQVGMVGIAVVGIIDLVMGGGRNYGFVLDGAMIATGVFFFLYLPRGALKPALRSWPAAGLVAWLAMTYAFLDFYPDVATSRSIAVKAQSLCDEFGDPQMPIIFFGRREESVIFYTPAKRIHQFQGHEPEHIVNFLRRHPHTVLVSDRNDIAELRPNLPANVAIKEMGGRGHLYLSSTAATDVASESGSTAK